MRQSPVLPEDLRPDSTVDSLRLYDVSFENTRLGVELADVFDRNPALPGVVLTEEKAFISLVSRRQFLEYLLLPQGLDLFLDNPLRVFFRYNRSELLVLQANTSILTAMQRALKRPPQLASEPLVVEFAPDHHQVLDFAQLSLAAWQLRGIETQVRYERSQALMIQNERMAMLGRLVDGIAHEILDPVGFIWGNLTHVSQYSKDILELISGYEHHIPNPPPSLKQLHHELEIDYLQEDFPRAVESITTGAQRLRDLATSLQNFCHVDDVYPKPADINSCLDGIVLLLKTRLSSEIELVKDYGQLPPVSCYIGRLTQVLVNILINSVDVLLNQAVTRKICQELDQAIDPHDPPRITISTLILSSNLVHTDAKSTISQSHAKRWAAIRIRDNGPGMPPYQQQRLRDSFSVERRVAKETSLALAYQIITAKHGGHLRFESELNQGTLFEILLPLV